MIIIYQAHGYSGFRLRKEILTVVVVAMMMLVPGCGEPSEDPDPIELSEGRVFARDTGTEWVYDVYFSIDEVNMAKPPVWEEIRVNVVTVDTTGFYPSTVFLIDREPLKRQPEFGASDDDVYYYQKAGLETKKISENGGITIKGMNLSFQNAQVSLTLDQETLGFIILPGLFPVPPCYITLSEASISPIQTAGTDRWEATWTVLDITPEDFDVPFPELYYHVIGYGGDLFFSYRLLEPDMTFGGAFDPDLHGEEMHAWYVSVTNESVLRVGDTIRMTYIDQEYERAKIELRLTMRMDYTKVKTTYLPEDFQ